MKKLIVLLLLGLCVLTNCSKKSDVNTDRGSGNSNCGTYKSGQQLYLGPEGGCYYMSSGGNKEYVERSACKCGL
ncbi:hypothetical protein [Mucilaginibacter sp. SG564]|uniref:hypothetical protein n=1 Tax=Mucilaginibacter sp. SG564 TaxID=2587022 RepID=UPI001557EECF|nr:hypothetical protein [Mucilaginibacter sp. SG564]NOW98948.1 hypothetical protein [Mucilaginibacter sp. SG564]